MLAVDEPRLNSLYDEALRLNPSTLTNAGALLTRVFLELSTEHFFKTMKVPVPPKHERSGRSNWSDFGISLKEKIACALRVLDLEEHNRDIKQPRNALFVKLAVHSVAQMHNFIHKLKTSADQQNNKKRTTTVQERR